jgi:phage-related minor tail protein
MTGEDGQTDREHPHIHARLDSQDRRLETMETRQRSVEQAVTRLGDLPDAIDRMSERLEHVIRLDERTSRVEEDQRASAAAADKLDTRIDELEKRVARWGGGVAVLLLALELFGEHLIPLIG